MDALILIVVFNGEATLKENLSRLFLMDEIDNALVMIIDNASSDSSADIAASFLANNGRGRNVLFIQFPENRGVASAYNRGMKEALIRGIPWMMILDQDSQTDSALLLNLVRAAKDLTSRGNRVGGVAPIAVNGCFPDNLYYPYLWKDHSFVSVDPFNHNGLIVPIDSTITSGTLYNVNALKDIGGFKDIYFIDFVDHECHIRLKLRGWQLWCDKNSKIVHYLGHEQRMTPHGIWIEHLPFRYFFMVRNMLDGYFRLSGLKGLIIFAGQISGHMMLIFRYSKRPWKILSNIIRGIQAFLLGRWDNLVEKTD